MATHNDYGRWGEQKAAEYLQQKGYTIVHRDWTPDGGTLAIVEVKTRSGTDVTRPEEAVDWRKMRSIALAADAYLRRYQMQCDVRFDIVTVVGNGEEARVDHIENAFVPPMR